MATEAANAAYEAAMAPKPTWRDRLGTPEERAWMWKVCVTAAIAFSIGRYYYAWYRHGLEMEALRAKAEQLDADLTALNSARLDAMRSELRDRHRFSDAELAESMRVLRAVVDETDDVETAIDAHIIGDFETNKSNKSIRL